MLFVDVYMAVWLVTTLLVLVEGRRFRSDRTPPAHPVAVSLLAGALWPFLLLGLVELGVVAIAGRAMRNRSATTPARSMAAGRRR